MGKTFAIERAATYRTGEQLADLLNQSATGALQPPHHRIGVEHRDPGALEHLRHGRLAHADRPGERDPDHAASNPRSRSAPSNGISGMPRIVK